MPSLIPGMKRLFDDGFNVGGTYVRGQTYESNVPYVLRFLVDNSISGSDWIEFPGNTYSLRGRGNSNSSTQSSEELHKTSRCSLEVDIFYNQLIAHPPDGLYSTIAPLRILSFDIECQGRKGHFPEAQVDPVIQIASCITLQGSDQPIIKTVYVLNTCLPIVGCQVIAHATEAEMLLAWKNFVLATDPDIVTGYNIANFDIPYLLNRAKVHYVLTDLHCTSMVVYVNSFHCVYIYYRLWRKIALL